MNAFFKLVFIFGYVAQIRNNEKKTVFPVGLQIPPLLAACSLNRSLISS